MTASARATAGAAFRLPPISDDDLISETSYHAAQAAWWRAHVNLLRRLLAAQPEAGYPRHGFHLAVLRHGEDWIEHFEGRKILDPWTPRSKREDMEEAISDFGPAGHVFGRHPDRPGLYGWWPRLDRGPLRSSREFAAQFEAERRCAALADIEAELPPDAPGAPALPAATPVAETPEKRLARLKRQLGPLAAVYYDTPPAQLPEDVVNVLVEIADAAGGDMAKAIAAWHEACAAAGAE